MAGNVYDIVVLSSSPPLIASSPHNAFSSTPRQRVSMPPSSPPPFSPSASPKLATSGASKPSPRGAAIPEGAVRGFATVSSLVRSEHFATHPEGGEQPAQVRASSRPYRISSEDIHDGPEPSKKRQSRATAKALALADNKPSKTKPRARISRANKEDHVEDPELRKPNTSKSTYFTDERTIMPSKATPQDEPKLTKSGKPRKPRAKKETATTQTEADAPKPRKPRVPKAKAGKQDGKVQRADASVVSAHFTYDVNNDHAARGVTEPVDEQDRTTGRTTIWEVPQSPRLRKGDTTKARPCTTVLDDLNLEEAVTRRRDWTPPRDTVAHLDIANSIGKENELSANDTHGGFTNLLSNFAYAQSGLVQQCEDSPINSESVAATKRRRVELVEVPGNQANSRDTSPEKGKAPKKKARTITDIVTEQYAPKEPIQDLQSITSNFFEPKTSTISVPLNDVALPGDDAPAKKPVRRRKSPKSASNRLEDRPKARKTSAKSAKKAKPVAEVLLSPSSALTRLNRQDILFGTSSQLAMDESPNTVRQIQLAIKRSEEEHDLDEHALLGELRVPPSRWPRLGSIESKRGLWSVSTRDDHGGLLAQTENIYIPAPDRTQDIPLLMDGACDEPQQPDGEIFIDIDDLETAPTIIISSDAPTRPHKSCGASQPAVFARSNSSIQGTVFEDIDDIEQEPPPSNQNADSQHSLIDVEDPGFRGRPKDRASDPPKLRPSATKASSTSPKKSRGRPPKAQSAISTHSLSVEMPKTGLNTQATILLAPSTPPRSSSRFIDIEEILDSEDETLEALSPTPPRLIKFHDVPPLPLVTADGTPVLLSKKQKLPSDDSIPTIHRIAATHLEWNVIKPTIFSSVTAHIRSLPPTTDPKSLTWHEKILMYDPIVLEEFTAYLNANTSIRTFRKATQKQIKAFNQELKLAGEPVMSVGQSGEEVLAVHKELEAYMVQSWCESMSVCCIWGEGRGKGGARKGLY